MLFKSLYFFGPPQTAKKNFFFCVKKCPPDAVGFHLALVIQIRCAIMHASRFQEKMAQLKINPNTKSEFAALSFGEIWCN